MFNEDELYKFYLKGWNDSADKVESRPDIKKGENAFAYELGIIDWSLGYGILKKEEVAEYAKRRGY